jgi:CheY-like chemotaxis protein
MPRTPVLLLEDNPAEATLAESALLFAGAEVVASPERAVVALLGRKALREQPRLAIPAVAILPEPTAEERARALAQGVRAVYERPRTWQAYTALLGRVLAEWLPTRKD